VASAAPFSRPLQSAPERVEPPEFGSAAQISRRPLIPATVEIAEVIGAKHGVFRVSRLREDTRPEEPPAEARLVVDPQSAVGASEVVVRVAVVLHFLHPEAGEIAHDRCSHGSPAEQRDLVLARRDVRR
jgi:hypothetical protein